MKILFIGGNGTIGSQVVSALNSRHEVITVGRKSGEVQADIADSSTIQTMFETVGQVDAVVNASGEAKWHLSKNSPRRISISG